jgi:FkbM family methyltransferase
MNIKELKNYINRPEYVFRPWQIYHKIFNKAPSLLNNIKEVILPWGTTISIPLLSDDTLIKSLLIYGIYDLSLTELVWRLIELGETAIDIGANLGYVTSLMSVKVGNIGKVWCFEPNPEVYQELTANIGNWKIKGFDNIYPQQIALSNHSGNGVLNLTPKNRGEVFIDKKQEVVNIQANSKNACVVDIERLDNFLKTEQNCIGVLKIDVEGHELEVLQGAGDLISNHKIRDIIFEEHNVYPSPLTGFLEQNGYTVFRIWKGFWKPRLESPNLNKTHSWEPPNYLATCNPKRATKLVKSWGWKSLSCHTN